MVRGILLSHRQFVTARVIALIFVPLVLLLVVTACEKETPLPNPTRKDAQSVSAATSAKNLFFLEVAKNRVVWAIRDANGFPTSTANGKSAMPFWSTKERAEAVIQQSPPYNDFEPHLITWDNFRENWLAGMERDKIHVGINWAGEKALGYDLDPQTVSKGIGSLIASCDNEQ